VLPGKQKTNLKVGTGRKCEEKYFLAPGVVREQVIYTPFERFMGHGFRGPSQFAKSKREIQLI